MTDDRNVTRAPLTRRSAFTALAAGVAVTGIASFAADAGAQPRKDMKMMNTDQGATNKDAVNAVVRGGGLLVVAQWETKDGQADAVADILARYLPQAQSDPGVKLFLIARAKDNPAQFLFYELFADAAAYEAHQARAYFKTLIAGQALALLSKRERTQYSLL
ncbi:MAG: putative quinol monooxygenase [Rhizomicrobium sp.]